MFGIHHWIPFKAALEPGRAVKIQTQPESAIQLSPWTSRPVGLILIVDHESEVFTCKMLVPNNKLKQNILVVHHIKENNQMEMHLIEK